MSDSSQRKYLADYRPSPYLIDAVDLDFDIQDNGTRVVAVSTVRRNSAAGDTDRDWTLDGRGMRLESVSVDGRELADDAYRQSETALVLEALPEAFELTVVTWIDPDSNLSLEGLYRSGPILCTQCEATGFSRITYFADRPDVMSRYRTRITADASRYPVLLSNGNRVDEGTLDDGRHYAVFDDPFAKPCYLFALVAGDLGVIHDSYTTASGKPVALALYTEHGNEPQCHHAMASLKAAMAWDEQTYGLEYDLDSFIIVAVASFNMGAMENKSLNVFNTACIFAAQDTATDADFARVRDVVAHEYFHNYTGNRVTCRDWFQLSLKEGLTVYREHQFAIDHGSPGVTRIEQVRMIREVQFPEDAGPRAHPIRPESYLEMNNFYTITVYEKGAEVIRMIAQMAGREAFLTAVKYYLNKHDGQAVTIEDFVVAMEESTGLDLAQFRHWYAYAGTPGVALSSVFDNGTLDITMTQHVPDTPGQGDKPAFDIPISLQLFDRQGTPVAEPGVLRLNQAKQHWQFQGLAEMPYISALRGFTAPVRLDVQQDEAELALLMARDTDPVARWDAAQALYLQTLTQIVQAELDEQQPPAVSEVLLGAIGELLDAPPTDLALLAEMLTLPSASRIGDSFEAIPVAAVDRARRGVKERIAERFSDRLWALAEAHAPRSDYRFNQEQAGRRRVFAVALDYLAGLTSDSVRARAKAAYDEADNMTDRMAALFTLNELPSAERDQALADFAERFADYPLVMDKWLRLQVTGRDVDAVARVRELLDDARFDFTNPNRIRALLGGLVRGNPVAFHHADGAGYALLVDEILRLDALNPQLAASLAGLLAPWRRYAQPYAQGMREALVRLDGQPLSDNTREIVDAGLQG